MRLEDFKLVQVVFEVRYENAFLLWDCAGALHVKLSQLWPQVSLVEGDPTRQLLKGKGVEIKSGLNSSHIALMFPSTVVKHSEIITETLKVWTSILHISSFSRVGTRVIMGRTYKSEEEARSAIVSMGLVNIPAAPIFSHKHEPHAVEAQIVWRDGDIQTRFVTKVENHKIEVGDADSNEVAYSKEFSRLVLDIDRSTVGTVELAKFRAADWLEGIRHQVNRDLPRMIGGI